MSRARQFDCWNEEDTASEQDSVASTASTEHNKKPKHTGLNGSYWTEALDGDQDADLDWGTRRSSRLSVKKRLFYNLSEDEDDEDESPSFDKTLSSSVVNSLSNNISSAVSSPEPSLGQASDLGSDYSEEINEGSVRLPGDGRSRVRKSTRGGKAPAPTSASSKQRDRSGTDIEDSQSFMCRYCKVGMVSKGALHVHKTRVHKPETVCNICGQIFKNLKMAEAHFEHSHPNTILVHKFKSRTEDYYESSAYEFSDNESPVETPEFQPEVVKSSKKRLHSEEEDETQDETEDNWADSSDTEMRVKTPQFEPKIVKSISISCDEHASLKRKRVSDADQPGTATADNSPVSSTSSKRSVVTETNHGATADQLPFPSTSPSKPSVAMETNSKVHENQKLGLKRSPDNVYMRVPEKSPTTQPSVPRYCHDNQARATVNVKPTPQVFTPPPPPPMYSPPMAHQYYYPTGAYYSPPFYGTGYYMPQAHNYYGYQYQTYLQNYSSMGYGPYAYPPTTPLNPPPATTPPPQPPPPGIPQQRPTWHAVGVEVQIPKEDGSAKKGVILKVTQSTCDVLVLEEGKIITTKHDEIVKTTPTCGDRVIVTKGTDVVKGAVVSIDNENVIVNVSGKLRVFELRHCCKFVEGKYAVK